MLLSEKYTDLIAGYINEIEEYIGEKISVEKRARILERFRRRVEEKLRSTVQEEMSDLEITAILHKMGDPSTQAAVLIRVWGDGTEGDALNIGESTQENSFVEEKNEAPAATEASKSEASHVPVTPQNAATVIEPAPEPIAIIKPKPIAEDVAANSSETLKEETAEHAVWLGGAWYAAKKSGWPAWSLRSLFVLLGLVTGPIALLLYMSAFIMLRMRGAVKAPAPFHPSRVILNPLFTVGVMILFYLGGIYGIKGVCLAHEKYLSRAVPDLNDWAWLELQSGRMFGGALLLLLPLALFSAMPLANGWDFSLKRFTQAGVILYAIAVSFGLASFITGIIIVFVNEFAG
ncbi:MAG: hypothetical protein GX117_04765 [Candidatus Hydrogenedentes bacterium]|nr:hypothetical protein [Candidatus Hydrogenedentota bacterium]